MYHPDYVNNKIATHFLNHYKASSDQYSFDSRIALGLLGVYESLIDKHKNKWHPVKDRGAIKRFDHDNQVVSIQWHHNNDGVDLYDQQQLLANINDLRLQKGILTCCFENQEVQMYVHQTNEQDKVSIQQQSYCFNRFPAVVNKEGNVSSGDLKASLPGSIVKIMCQPGQQVQKGDRLLVMEAMKMEHPMIAPFDGYIDHVQVDEGDRVSLGDILIQMSKKDTKG